MYLDCISAFSHLAVVFIERDAMELNCRLSTTPRSDFAYKNLNLLIRTGHCVYLISVIFLDPFSDVMRRSVLVSAPSGKLMFTFLYGESKLVFIYFLS